MPHRLILNTVAALAIAAAASPLLTSGAQAYACKPSAVQASAVAPQPAIANSQARASWTSKVKNDLGLSWSVWTVAANKTVNCAQSGAQHICVATAKPCNYVVQ